MNRTLGIFSTLNPKPQKPFRVWTLGPKALLIGHLEASRRTLNQTLTIAGPLTRNPHPKGPKDPIMRYSGCAY